MYIFSDTRGSRLSPFIHSGADLAALVREASVQTLKDFMKNDAQANRGKTGLVVTMQHFEHAFTKLRPSVSLEVSFYY